MTSTNTPFLSFLSIMSEELKFGRLEWTEISWISSLPDIKGKSTCYVQLEALGEKFIIDRKKIWEITQITSAQKKVFNQMT